MTYQILIIVLFISVIAVSGDGTSDGLTIFKNIYDIGNKYWYHKIIYTLLWNFAELDKEISHTLRFKWLFALFVFCEVSFWNNSLHFESKLCDALIKYSQAINNRGHTQ